MEEGIKGREAGVRTEEGEEVTASEMVSGEGKKEGCGYYSLVPETSLQFSEKSISLHSPSVTLQSEPISPSTADRYGTHSEHEMCMNKSRTTTS